jgi:bifunctional non-homologous end joining protein LigD
MASPLDDYNRKRDFKKTNEPSGKPGRKSKEPIFVVQKHAASHLHYDFRLEAGGRLLSWAVPKGPSLDPKDKRLAVQVEDHPLSYANFEGRIPEGQYGAGEVIVWDTGHFLPEGASKVDKNIEQAILDAVAKGKLTFTLTGKKLAGSWSLVRMHTKDGSKKNWLLVKNNDEYASSRRHDIKPMLATLTDAPFKNEAYIFEPKLDGIRILAYLQRADVTLLSRNGLDVTKKFPEIVCQLASLDIDCVLDGELVALNEKGEPSFELLQARSIIMSKSLGKRSLELRYIVFDILQNKGVDLTSQSLSQRKKVLAHTFKPGQSKNLQLIKAYDVDGIKAFARAIKEGMEGVVGKKLDGRYEEGKRSGAWLKVKAVKSSEFVICGYTAGSGSR